mmetsp:Transcript_16289/g.63505  ORF Transcript_16289/g.63505 Transcript_16289/m.63505 type:complete len:248 (+) Transcript_16289:61-804(+)
MREDDVRCRPLYTSEGCSFGRRLLAWRLAQTVQETSHAACSPLEWELRLDHHRAWGHGVAGRRHAQLVGRHLRVRGHGHRLHHHHVEHSTKHLRSIQLCLCGERTVLTRVTDCSGVVRVHAVELHGSEAREDLLDRLLCKCRASERKRDTRLAHGEELAHGWRLLWHDAHHRVRGVGHLRRAHGRPEQRAGRRVGRRAGDVWLKAHVQRPATRELGTIEEGGGLAGCSHARVGDVREAARLALFGGA